MTGNRWWEKVNYYSFKIFHRFWLPQNPWLILHNYSWCGPNLEDTSNIPSIGWYIDLETRLLNGILIWRPGYMGNRTSINLVSKARRPSCLFTSEQQQQKNGVHAVIRRRINWLNGRKLTKTRTIYCSMDVIYFLGSICKKNLCLYPETVQNTGQQKSLRGSKLVPIFGVNNKTILEFGLRRMWRIMQNIIQPPSIIAK